MLYNTNNINYNAIYIYKSKIPLTNSLIHYKITGPLNLKPWNIAGSFSIDISINYKIIFEI